MKQKRTYTYQFSPAYEQKMLLVQTFGCCRYVYNWALRKKTDAYYQDSIRLCYTDLNVILTLAKMTEPLHCVVSTASRGKHAYHGDHEAGNPTREGRNSLPF